MFNGATYDGTATQFAGAGGFMAEYVRATEMRDTRGEGDARLEGWGDGRQLAV